MVGYLTRHASFLIIVMALSLTVAAGGDVFAEAIWYVDDDAPNDPAHGDPTISDPAEDGSADHPFDAIQEALDAASDTDTIIVRDGIYAGAGNRDIDFNGKAVHLRSENGPASCIIDCGGSRSDPHRGFYFHSGEDESSVVDGFTIKGGLADEGGAIKCEGSSPTIANNTITANSAMIRGGGMSCHDSRPRITNNTIVGNTADWGGGIACAGSSCRPAVANCIIWGNDAPNGAQIAIGAGSQVTVAYSNIEGGAAGVHTAPGTDVQWGAGNIDADPVFARPADEAGIDTGLGGVTKAEISDFMNGVLSPAMARLVEGVPADNIFFIDNENGDDSFVGGVPVNDGHSPDKAVKTFDELFHHGAYDERVAAIPEQETVVAFVLGEKLTAGTIRRPNVKFVGVDYPLLYSEVIQGECQGACTVTVFAENIEICGFRIEHLCGNGIDVMSDDCHVHHNRFQGAILAGGDVTIGAYDDIVSGCVVEHNVFAGGPANPMSLRILRRARKTVVRYNKFYGSETFVKFYGGTDCSSQNNVFFDHDTSKGRKPVAFDAEAVRCFSLNDRLEGELLEPSDYYIDQNATNCFVLSTPGRHGDYHLKSEYGRWDPIANAGEGGWVLDDITSPCIDTGDPDADYANEPMPNFGRINMGAYGNTTEASRTRPPKNWYVDDDAPNDPSPGDPAISDPAEDGSADHPFDAIQEALDAAPDGDSIIVRDGLYTGNGNRDIDFSGKAVHLRSENGAENCIIDCQQQGRGFYLHSGENEDSVVDGFTITNGNAFGGSGGGIFCWHSSPTITNNTITGNTVAGNGGGIYCRASTPTITNNNITDNTADSNGGGIYCLGFSAAITNNTITANTAFNDGGGIYYYSISSGTIIGNTISNNNALASYSKGGGIHCIASSPTITNNTITDNTADSGGGICSGYNSWPTITNCILWANGDDLYDSSATYSCIQDGDPGEGNIDADPLFADPDNGDYHLKSQYGRWQPIANDGDGAWVLDDVTSPCIDTGDPDADYADEPMPNFGRINIGAYGNTAQASKSGWNIPGDVNDDCSVDILDMIVVRNKLNKDTTTEDNWKADVTRDGSIDILDLILVRNNLNARCE